MALSTLRLKPGIRVAIVGSQKYEGRRGRISQVNHNRSGSVTYFVALDKPLRENGAPVYEVRAGSDHVRVIE